jgi:hypothetical protein
MEVDNPEYLVHETFWFLENHSLRSILAQKHDQRLRDAIRSHYSGFMGRRAIVVTAASHNTHDQIIVVSDYFGALPVGDGSAETTCAERPLIFKNKRSLEQAHLAAQSSSYQSRMNGVTACICSVRFWAGA